MRGNIVLMSEARTLRGCNAPMATRPDYRAAVALKNHLYRNSEDFQKPIPPQDQDRVEEEYWSSLWRFDFFLKNFVAGRISCTVGEIHWNRRVV